MDAKELRELWGTARPSKDLLRHFDGGGRIRVAIPVQVAPVSLAALPPPTSDKFEVAEFRREQIGPRDFALFGRKEGEPRWVPLGQWSA